MNFKLHFLNVKCSQKLVNLGNPFSFHTSDPKVIYVLFFCRYPLAFSSLPPLAFLFSWMFVWAAISFQLQEYIAYG